MFGLFRRRDEPPVETHAQEAPRVITLEVASPFELVAHLEVHEGLPSLDWDAVFKWTDSINPEELRDEAWVACLKGWMLHLRDALGEGYHLDESEGAVLLSSLESNRSRATLELQERTLDRVARVLDGIARPEGLANILVVFDDDDAYYRYASRFYPERGEFAFSGGMHISRGCSHFITKKSDLWAIEATIAHEMTHGCVRHLPLPLWLNEGLAVNTEHRIAGATPRLFTPREMHAKHLAYWDDATIQEFWSGDSYDRTDDGNMLSYDLGRIMVEHMSGDWARFREFVLAATYKDAGAAAARAHLGVDLGVMVAALLEKGEGADWAPDPQRWKHTQTETE